MNCTSFHRSLEDYLEGGLDFAGRFGMERHAQQCYLCGKSIADAQHLSESAREMRKVRAPENFEAVVIARINARHSTSWYQRILLFGIDLSALRPWVVGATSVMILGLGVLLVSERERLFAPRQGARPLSARTFRRTCCRSRRRTDVRTSRPCEHEDQRVRRRRSTRPSSDWVSP